jgi:class 3 adenylate cyclase/tetratricopeptide (TPR) repeat protein
MLVCPSCSAENPDTARFCHSCGAALEVSAPPAREERKVVTVLFADLVGFTARAEQLDPEDVRGLLAPYHARLRAELERFGGTVEKFIGDAVVALFGAPTAHEDDPERAVRAALAIRDWVTQEGNELQLRVAVNTGEALIALGARPAEGEGMASGDVINTAARLQSAAPVNGILVGETTYRATNDVITYRGVEPVEAKGKAAPIPVWEALEARSRYGVDLAQARTPLIGRERELDALRDALDRARSQRLLQLVTLVGVPGIGKSRLVHELFGSLEAEPDFTTWRQGRSLPYGEGVSFWALAEIVKAQAGILESDSAEEVERKLTAAVEGVAADPREAEWMAARLRSLVGLHSDRDDSQSESFSAWRRFLEGLAERHPLVLVFEDLHWADEGLLDFVDDLVDWARGAPLFVLCTARPELLERRPGWGGGKTNAATISLPPLADDESARLFASLLEQPLLEADTQAVLLSRAAGNPLYAEQYARMLSERGDAEDLPLPETVQGIIAARLDGLSETEKTLLQDAAVVGKVFWHGAVATIGGIEPRAAEDALRGLERKELVERARRSSVQDEIEYAFAHLLVRDVAYGQIPRMVRGDKHRAAAAWIERLGRSEDQAEMLAHHYSSALEYLRAAGQDVGALAEPTRVALANAGDRAAGLHAWPAAAGFYEDALDLCPEGDPAAPYLRFRLGQARVNDTGAGIELLEESVDGLAAGGDVEAAAEAAVATARAYWARGDVERHERYLDRTLELVADCADSPARVRAMAARAAKHMYDGELEESIAAIGEAMPDAKRLGLGEVRVRLLELRGFCRVRTGDEGGFDDFAASIALALEIHAFDQLHSSYNNLFSAQLCLGDIVAAKETFPLMEENARKHPTDYRRRWIQVAKAELLMIDGDWISARPIVERSIAEAEETPHYSGASALMVRARMQLAAGDLDGASGDTEAALELAQQSGDGQLVAPALVRRSAVLLELGRRGEAGALAAEALEYGARLSRVLNDVPVVDAAWVMLDLGLEEDYRACLQAATTTRWMTAAVAICSSNFAGSADFLEEMGDRTSEAYARLRAAKQLVEEGRRGEADAQLARSLAFWREVGATRYVREGEALLAESA